MDINLKIVRLEEGGGDGGLGGGKVEHKLQQTFTLLNMPWDASSV